MEILTLIDRLENLVTSASRVPATHKVILDLERVLSLVDQLRLGVPKDVQDAEQILAKKETLLNHALMEARRIKTSAEEESRSRVDQSEIVKGANRRAEQTLAEAKAKADEMVKAVQDHAQKVRQDANTYAQDRIADSNNYARDVLYSLEQQLSNLLGSIRRGLDVLDVEREELEVK
ncbi:MAG: hypothetical protein HYU29_07430 [Chloroflexi bacterium]|nr:hypothetical protein [Chloroflexota bacterium]